jgi:hypothetical protein
MNKTRSFLAVAFVAALVITSMFLWGPVFAQDKAKVAPAPMKWEYKVIIVGGGPHVDAADMEKSLNKLGAEGWDCVGTVSEVTSSGRGAATDSRALLICKRAKQ